MKYTQVDAKTFANAVKGVWDVRKGNVTVGSMLAPHAIYAYYFDGARCYLAENGKSGFVVRPAIARNFYGDLQTVWSVDPGRGNELVHNAKHFGAQTLDCFDGFLPSFYSENGFVEYAREKNWTAGDPDVVFMTI